MQLLITKEQFLFLCAALFSVFFIFLLTRLTGAIFRVKSEKLKISNHKIYFIYYIGAVFFALFLTTIALSYLLFSAQDSVQPNLIEKASGFLIMTVSLFFTLFYYLKKNDFKSSHSTHLDTETTNQNLKDLGDR